MSNFYVRIKPEFNGTNMVHKKGCPFMPDAANRIPLGEFSSDKNAVKEAERFFSRINGCYFCIKECHEPWIASRCHMESDQPINKPTI
jgi:hypothetical protein